MPSSYTVNLGVEKIGSGEQAGTWGTTTNLNLDIIDRAINGVGAITLSGTSHTLTTTDGALSEGGNKVLVLGGSPSGTNTITISPNDQDKMYFVHNNSGQDCNFYTRFWWQRIYSRWVKRSYLCRWCRIWC